jgi:hypothetical protein
MKKIYQIPDAKVTNVLLTAIMSASDPKATVDPTEPPINPGNVESRRRRDVWDDEID